MEVKFKLSKYDILGVASIIGASEEEMEKIEKYIDENESVEAYLPDKKSDGYAEYKTAIGAIAVAQISKNLGL